MSDELKDRRSMLQELGKLQGIINLYQKRVKELTQTAALLKEEAEGLRRVLEQLPLQLQVYGPDGVSQLVSKALLDEFNLIDARQVIGHYNIFEDPAIKAMGRMELVKRAFAGEMISGRELDTPLKELAESYEVRYDEIISLFQNVLLVPIFNQEGTVIKVVALLETERTFKIKDSIGRALRFLQENYQDDYDLDKVAKVAGLSPYHFTRLFKEEVGETPKKYFTKIKITMTKEKLVDRSLSVSQAFSQCGLDYNSYYAKLFKEIVGVTPSQFRRLSPKSNPLPK